MYLNGVEVDSVRTVYVNNTPGDCNVYIGNPPPVTGEEGEPPTKQSTALKWALASYYLYGDTISAGAVSALHAVGPYYCGEFHGTNSAGSYPGMRSVLAVAAAVRDEKFGRDGAAGLRVQLPAPSKLMIALNAALATRVHNTSAPASGDNKYWLKDMESHMRDHLRDRGPDTAYDKVSSIQSMTAAGIITAFLEGGVSPVRPKKVADVLQDVAPGGISAALGLLAASDTVIAVNTSLQLLCDWSQFPPAQAEMERLRAHLVVAQQLALRSKTMLFDETTMQLCLCLCGLWDGMVVEPKGTDLAASRVPSHLVMWGHRNADSRSAAGTSTVGYRPVLMGGSNGNLLGQVISDAGMLRHVLLNNNLWLDFTQAGQKLFLDAVFKSTSNGNMMMPLRKFNRNVLRQEHVFRYMLIALVDARLSAERLPEVLLVLRYLLLDEIPYQPHIAAFSSFLSATLSSQLSQTLLRLNGDTLHYPILAITHATSPMTRSQPTLVTAFAQGSGDVTPVAAIARASADGPDVPASKSKGSKRERQEALANTMNQVVVTVRNHLMELFPWLVHLLVSKETPLTFRYRNSIMKVMPLRWLGLFLDSNNHITTVTLALKLTAELVPLYGPKLVGPGGEKSLAKVRPLGHRMPTFHYLSKDVNHVAAIAEHLMLLFHITFGNAVPVLATRDDFTYSFNALKDVAGDDPFFKYPDFFHVIVRILTRTFTATPDAPEPLVSPAVTSVAPVSAGVATAMPAVPPRPPKRTDTLTDSDDELALAASKRHDLHDNGDDEHGSDVDVPSPTPVAVSMFATPAVSPSLASKKIEAGTSVVTATIKFFTHLRTVCPSFEKYIQKNRERVLSEYAGLAYAAAIATMRAWRAEHGGRDVARRGASRHSDSEGDDFSRHDDAAAAHEETERPPPPAFYPFHHDTAVTALQNLSELLASWISSSVKKGVASLEYVLSLHPSIGEPPLFSGHADMHHPTIFTAEYESLAVAFQTQVCARRRASGASLDACDVILDNG